MPISRSEWLARFAIGLRAFLPDVSGEWAVKIAENRWAVWGMVCPEDAAQLAVQEIDPEGASEPDPVEP